MSATPKEPQVRETEDLPLVHPQVGDLRPAGIFIGAGSLGLASPRRATQWGEDFADRDEFGLNRTGALRASVVGPRGRAKGRELFDIREVTRIGSSTR